MVGGGVESYGMGRGMMGAETGRMHGDGVQVRRAGEACRMWLGREEGRWLVVGGRAG